MTTYSQDPSAILNYTLDWTAMLAANGGTTISTDTVTPTGGIVISSHSHTTTAVTFRVAASGVTTIPSMCSAVVHVVLSDGEEDERTVYIQVTNR